MIQDLEEEEVDEDNEVELLIYQTNIILLQKIEMQIVPTATNTEKILFYQEPRLKVFETFKPFVATFS